MFILTTIEPSSSVLLKRRLFVHSSSNITDDLLKTNMSLSMNNKYRTVDNAHIFNIMKDGSNLTKTQIKVLITVVIIISFIMFIITIFRFKNACRDQETQSIQTEILRQRVSQFSEPSSRRGSIGYYTRKYIRTPDEQLNRLSTSSTKRYSIPVCNQSLKPVISTVPSTYLPKQARSSTVYQQNHYDKPNNTADQHVSIPINSIVRKSSTIIGLSRCDDQTPLLTSELASTIKDSSNRTTRKYSLNAFIPLLRSSNSHPLFSSSSTTPTAFGSNIAGDDNKTRNSIDIKSRRRISLSSTLRRNSFAKQPQAISATTDTSHSNQLNKIDSDNNTEQASSSSSSSTVKNKTINSKTFLRKKSSSVAPCKSSTYRKDFMQKIERFRFIDDSASSTTTVTSPVESIDRINGHQPCSHLITSAIEQFDDYVRSRYNNTNEIDSYIDRLNSDILTNGSYSDLNILNGTNGNVNNQHQQQMTFKPVNNITNKFETDDYRQTIRNTPPVTIPSQHSKHTYPSDTSLPRPTTIITNGHSRSMDFHSNKTELMRPMTLLNPGTIYETSSSSIATLTSGRSIASLEFNDDTKPSGVLVDDDFLPMSSPVDDHFWDMTTPTNQYKFSNHKKECFPNVGSSPDIEVKPFAFPKQKPLTSSSNDQPLSETSCDEDDDDNDRSLNQQKYSIHEYKLKELQKPIVIHHSILNPSIHSIETTTQLNENLNLPSIENLSLENSNDESLLDKFVASANSESVQIPVRSPPLRTPPIITNDISFSSQQYPQTIYEEDDTQESSTNDNVSDESADNGEIDLVHEFELSQKQEQTNINNNTTTNLWSTNDRDIFILQEDDLLSALVTTPTQMHRPPPPSIMKITHNKSIDSLEETQTTTTTATTTPNALKPKVRFNLDPEYEREREWNKVNKLLGNSVEWTDEFEV